MSFGYASRKTSAKCYDAEAFAGVETHEHQRDAERFGFRRRCESGPSPVRKQSQPERSAASIQFARAAAGDADAGDRAVVAADDVDGVDF